MEGTTYDPAAIRWADLRGAQRPQAHPRDGDRGDGRPQARRVRTDPHVSRPFLRQEGQACVGARRLKREDEMSKTGHPRSLADNEAKAVARMLRISPQKLNPLAQLIRRKKVQTALADLEFSRKRIAKDVRNSLESAIPNP